MPQPQSDIVIQKIVLPDPELFSDGEMFVHRDPGVTLDIAAQKLSFLAGAAARFDTYFNLFNLGVWSGQARLDGLSLRLHGTGRVAVQFTSGRFPSDRFQLMREHTQLKNIKIMQPERVAPMARDLNLLAETEVRLTKKGVSIALDDVLGAGTDGLIPPQPGLIWVRLVALDDGAELTNGVWTTRASDGAAPGAVRLAISVTSFRREVETTRTVARVTAFLDAEAEALGADVDLQVVDNGQTLDLPPHPRLRVVQNANLGGAGGFARGLAEARTGGYTHVLFMDDDAAFAMENLRRTIAFLRLARSDKAAVSGAMISSGRPWTMWENGALFNELCHPLFSDINLRDPADVGFMEMRSADRKPVNFYGGWWYFAFPVAAVTHDPFPFFVRGDDISFSLANDFDIVTLNGVVSLQENFAAKESPLTLYLDVRNHLHHHLVHDFLDIGKYKTLKAAARFVMRGIVRMHYESAEATLEAWEDVMKGPDFFADNADMSVRRPQIQALAQTEKWRDIAPIEVRDREMKPRSKVFSFVMKLLLNGQFIPFYSRFGRARHIPAEQRGMLWTIWGLSEATFYDPSGTKGYTVRHDKRRGFQVLGRTLRTAVKWLRSYDDVKAAHRAGYARLTAPAFWQAQFGDPDAPAADPAPKG